MFICFIVSNISLKFIYVRVKLYGLTIRLVPTVNGVSALLRTAPMYALLVCVSKVQCGPHTRSLVQALECRYSRRNKLFIRKYIWTTRRHHIHYFTYSCAHSVRVKVIVDFLFLILKMCIVLFYCNNLPHLSQLIRR
jgi:hypothetical protein